MFRITGRTPLRGRVAVSGAKNAALPAMVAALLAEQPIELARVPRLRDVETQRQVLARLGVSSAWTEHGTLRFENRDRRPVRADATLVRRMRASFCVLGALVTRRRRAIVPIPGGCRIGDRPIDLHLRGLASLGADIRIHAGHIHAEARRLRGARVPLSGPHGPTVTGTVNVMVAATLAEGTTVISGAACEPEIEDLGRLLNKMGARIGGLGTPEIVIDGVDHLTGAAHEIIPDRIEAATLLMAIAVTGGSARVAGVDPEHLETVLEVLDQAGVELVIAEQTVEVRATRLRAISACARPYPGYPTDLQAQLTALACFAPGHSHITDAVFPHRFAHVAELRRLGARLGVSGNTAAVTGVSRLNGAVITAADLRSSAALVIAGLAAHGQTVIRRIRHLDRGYERLEEKLRRLGATIERVPAAGAIGAPTAGHQPLSPFEELPPVGQPTEL